MLDKTRLAKVLQMTTSTNDSEALAAVRKANEIIKGENLQWEDVITGGGSTLTLHFARPEPTNDGWIAPHLRDKVMIDLMFRGVYTMPRSDNEEWWQNLDRIHQSFLNHAVLTPQQYQLVSRAYQRVTKPVGAA